ncbi:MAG TPA: AI-2E family transporter YdiK [Caldimonas sp.]|jgi:predicted PurR-regulated permease PerM|nr:AI-2E family transporter YdiK [Caldimonas sp.]HEX4233653.1 AI-2E family transporter YdiK [Caldimonas sp.]
MKETRPDLARYTLGVLSVVAMIGASLWILRPFLGATIWAAMLVVTTWPALLWIQGRLWNRRSLAVLAMVLILLLLFVLPLTLAITTIAANSEVVVDWAKSLSTRGLPQMPDWMARLPLVGSKLAAVWDDLVASGVAGLEAKITPYARDVTAWVVTQAGVIGALTLQFLLTVIIAGIMYAQGETAATKVRRFGFKLGGTRGEDAVVLAGKAIRGVALGVGVTAIVQAVVGGIGLAIAGVPFAALLTAVMFMLCIIQIGPTLVMAPATIWVFWNGSTGWGVFLLVWTIVVGTMDNFLRPILIRRGADLPILLIFAGVIGGLLGFGLVGIFVGPVMLAVSYTLIDAWIETPSDSPQLQTPEAVQSETDDDRPRSPPLAPT